MVPIIIVIQLSTQQREETFPNQEQTEKCKASSNNGSPFV